MNDSSVAIFNGCQWTRPCSSFLANRKFRGNRIIGSVNSHLVKLGKASDELTQEGVFLELPVPAFGRHVVSA